MRTRTDGLGLQVAHPVGPLTRAREHEDRVVLTLVPDLDLVVGPGDAPAGREVAVVVAHAVSTGRSLFADRQDVPASVTRS